MGRGWSASFVTAMALVLCVPAGAAAQTTAGGSADGGQSAGPTSRPNIVMFYVDDVSPHDESLWNDPARTPNIHEHFIANGIRFDRAIAEDPLCCPARGNLLTGLHTHNNGVTANDATLFDPTEHIGKAMHDAGYATMFIGKYLNQSNLLTAADWDAHEAGWDALDVIRGSNGAYYSYSLHTNEGNLSIKQLHSTQMVGNRAVMHLQETPEEQPVFAILSIYNLHAPNRPMAQDIGDPRCTNKAPWNTPAYNEADVSDKPAYIQEKPLQPYADGWPMVGYCEEMLGVDRVVGQVVDELEAEGRLENTLLVFAADNGMGWGAHRLGQQKQWPYTTPVPLYMSWPAAGWGSTPRTISEITSNIDLAPTFCELAQTCTLGPFAHGKAGPDGVSLVPLIEGDVSNLGRDAVLEQSFISNQWSWTALRTTALFDADDRWHYIEYSNGAKELYDLVADPYELRNLASDPTKTSLIAVLAARLAELRLAGMGTGTGSITITEDTVPNSSLDYTFTGDLGTFVLDDDSDPTHPASITFTGVAAGTYTVRSSANPPWTLAHIECDGVAVIQGARQAKIYVHSGEHVSCTWTDATRRPDAMIGLSASGKFKTNNVYQTTPTTQTYKRSGVAIGGTYSYRLRIQNDSLLRDSFHVRADATGPATFGVTYTRDGEDVTALMADGTCNVDLVQPGNTREIIVTVTVGAGTPAGSNLTVVLTVTSASDPTAVDAVRFIAAR